MKLRAVTYAGAAVGVSLLVRSIVRRWTAYDLRGKVVLITGGSRDLGLVLARELVARGAKVAICARDEDELARAHVDLVRRGGHVLAVRCDITDRAQLACLVAETEQQLGPVN